MRSSLIYHTPINLSDNQNNNTLAKIVTLKSKETNAEIKSISKDGLSLNCDMQTLASILPKGRSVSPKQPVKLNVSFPLESMIHCICDTIYSRRISKDCFQLELRFDEISEESKEMINNFINSRFKKVDTRCSKPELSKVA